MRTVAVIGSIRMCPRSGKRSTMAMGTGWRPKEATLRAMITILALVGAYRIAQLSLRAYRRSNVWAVFP